MAPLHLKEAVLWAPLKERKVRCNLCCWRCTIAAGGTGRCYVRKNIDGTLYSLNYDAVCAANPDPIEKKPLFHFHPGSRSYSISAPGCNFQCVFCQNWQISQSPHDNIIDGTALTSEEIVEAAVRANCTSIAYTYTEPTVFMERCADTAVLAKRRGLSNVFVSNGYMTQEAIEFACPWLDGINVDLKAFSEEFYRDLCKAHLAPVLDTLVYLAKKTDVWLEITTLVIPGKNDSDQELTHLAEFIAQKLSPDVPWHISRFYPQYKLNHASPTATEILQRAYDIGRAAGLRYVYVGNLPGNRAESTWCHRCGTLLIERMGYRIRANHIADYRCPKCQADIAGLGLNQSKFFREKDNEY
jgi:pyruvate formate lyase activating enzyme